jgi:hypothetical protein
MTAPKSYTEIVSSQSYRIVRRALVREYIGCKPTIRESHALDNTALALERARLAQRDPATTPDMQCKLAAAANHWREHLAALANERKERLGTSKTGWGVMQEARV